MTGWAVSKLQDSRIYMCIKELKWELEAGDQTKRATIMAIAQFLRVEVLDEIENLLANPGAYNRDDLMQAYGMLEDIKIQNTHQIEATAKTLQHTGMPLPQFAIDHAKNVGRGLEVWMCTLGAGMAPKRAEDIRGIWLSLVASKPHLTEAITGLRAVELQTAVMTGSHVEGMFSDVDIDGWIADCEFLPDI